MRAFLEHVFGPTATLTVNSARRQSASLESCVRRTEQKMEQDEEDELYREDRIKFSQKHQKPSYKPGSTLKVSKPEINIVKNQKEERLRVKDDVF